MRTTTLALFMILKGGMNPCHSCWDAILFLTCRLGFELQIQEFALGLYRCSIEQETIWELYQLENMCMAIIVLGNDLYRMSSTQLLEPQRHGIGPGLRLYRTSTYPLSNKGGYNGPLDTLSISSDQNLCQIIIRRQVVLCPQHMVIWLNGWSSLGKDMKHYMHLLFATGLLFGWPFKGLGLIRDSGLETKHPVMTFLFWNPTSYLRLLLIHSWNSLDHIF